MLPYTYTEKYRIKSMREDYIRWLYSQCFKLETIEEREDFKKKYIDLFFLKE